ncbi:MAG: DNA-directed RNA polymerase subunit omega [Candidatus Marinimicrobia bacterium]|nr:DNA-directed RNA polymerase subunit omega [Candidatus Neomarinimicrobiota bacterium]
MAFESISIQKMENQTQDFYEAVVVMSRRAKQVLNNIIAEQMMVSNEEVEMGVYDQIFDKNPEDYEEIEKATTVAVKEFINGELVWKNSEEEA